MNKNPDFYLASTESYTLENPRGCYVIKKLAGLNPTGYLLVEIDPPIIGQKYGLGDKDIHQVIIATRHQNESLEQISCWPAYVHVARPLKSFNPNKEIGQEDIELIAWGELYPTYDRALNKV